MILQNLMPSAEFFLFPVSASVCIGHCPGHTPPYLIVRLGYFYSFLLKEDLGCSLFFVQLGMLGQQENSPFVVYVLQVRNLCFKRVSLCQELTMRRQGWGRETTEKAVP